MFNERYAIFMAALFCVLLVGPLAGSPQGRKSLAEWGLDWRPGWGRELVVGWLWGGVIVTALWGLLVSSGLARTAPGKPSHDWPAVVGLVALYFGVFFLQSALEEIVCRGILWTLFGRTGRRVGQTLLLTSAIFSLMHLGNPGTNGLALVNIFLVGLLFGLARGHTQRLWLPFGMHSLWNFLEGPVFGFPVSGMTTFRVWATDLSGPTVWTGGQFGPEASAFTTALLLAAVGVWAALARKITAGPTGGGGGSAPSTTLRTGLAWLFGGPKKEAAAEPGESVVANEPDGEEPPLEERGKSQPCIDELAPCDGSSPS